MPYRLPNRPPIFVSTAGLAIAGELSTMFAPPGALERAGESLGVKPEMLAVMEVRSGVCPLYRAILAYAAHGQEPNPPYFRPLLATSGGLYVRTDDDSDESDDTDAAESAFHRPLKRTKTQFDLGTGETDVEWPPPVVEDVGSEAKEELKGADKNGARTRRTNAQLVAAVKSARKYWKKSDAAKKGLEKTVVHILHFSEGEPKAVGRQLSKYHSILLASADGMNALRAFAEGITNYDDVRNYERGRSGKFVLYRFAVRPGRKGAWDKEGLRNARPRESVFLADGMLNNIMEDVREFLDPSAKAWYLRHGLPRRRSYLFHGVPGVGKTSTIRAVASTFNLNCCFLSMMTPDFNNQSLCDALGDIPNDGLIVLEDVDALFTEERKTNQGTSLTFSGMLNALDGIVSAEGVITVMTTNHIEKLDQALIRSGRVDRRFEFKYPTHQQIEQLFKSFYPSAPSKLATRFATEVMARPERNQARSIASLQQLFIKERQASAEACVDALPQFFSTFFPHGANGDATSLYM